MPDKRRRPPACLPEAFPSGLHMDVSRILCRTPRDPGRSFLWDCRHRQPHARHPFHPADHGCPAEARLGTACACTRWGLPCPASCLVGRCALTAPFHPCLRPKSHRRSVLCGTFPDSQPASRWALPTTVSCRVRTFLATRTRSPVHIMIVTMIFPLLKILEK